MKPVKIYKDFVVKSQMNSIKTFKNSGLVLCGKCEERFGAKRNFIFEKVSSRYKKNKKNLQK